MFTRMLRGWDLFKQSWAVLSLDKELLVFPILSGLACVLVIASFAAPVLAIPDLREAVFQAAGDAGEGADAAWQAWLPAVVGFLFYLVNFFVIAFFNTALVSAAMIRFRGGNPTVRDGLRAAITRLPQIAGWVLLAATVGMLLRAVEERMSFIGRFVVGLVGVAWAVVTFLVVPVLAAEGLGPLAAVKRSAVLLRKTWGESLVGQVSLGLASLLLALPAVLLMIGAIGLIVLLENLWLGIAAVALGIGWIVLAAIITSAVQQIFLTAVYIYAAQGQAPEGFSQELLASAFRKKGE